MEENLPAANMTQKSGGGGVFGPSKKDAKYPGKKG